MELQQCHRCRRQTSVTAGTIFDSTKLALTVWFQAIYLMTQDNKGVSAMKLHRHLGISYNAAWRMKHKLTQGMVERDRQHPLAGRIEPTMPVWAVSEAAGRPVAGCPARPPSSPPSRPTTGAIRLEW